MPSRVNPPSVPGSILVLQVDSDDIQVVSDVSDDDIYEIIRKIDSGHSDRLIAAEDRIRLLQKEILGDPDLVCEYLMLKQAEVRRDELLAADLQRLRDQGAVRERVAQYHRYTDVGTLLLYEHTEFRGAVRPFSITFPNLGWWPYCFNDKASSAVASGVNVIFEHSWYRGRKLVLAGFPWARFPNLGDFGFNDIASSVIAVP